MRKNIRIHKFIGTYILNIIFLLCVTLYVLVELSGPNVSIGESNYSLLNLLADKALLKKACNDVINADYLICYQFDASKWYAELLPVLSILPALYSYQKIDESIRPFMLIRMDINKYCILQFVCAFITGTSVSILGTTIYGLIVHMLLPDYDTNITILNELSRYYGATSEARMIFLIKKISDAALAGGLYALFGIIIYHVVHDKFLTVTIPMMLIYISDKLYILHEKERFSNLENIAPDYICVLFPSNISNMYNLLETELGVGYYWYFFYIIVTSIALYFLFRLCFEKCIRGS